MNVPPEAPKPQESSANREFYGRISYGAGGAAQPPKPKIVTPIRAAIVLLLLVPVLLVGYLRGWFRRGRDVRTTALVDVAPLPIDDKTVPLAGPVGADADGYPTQYVDPIVLRSMLVRRRYADLSTFFEQFQDVFEADPKHEQWIEDAAAAFASADPETGTRLDAWVAASPTSFAPYLARGVHRVSVGTAKRGSKFISQTSKGDLDAMHAAFESADGDLAKALAIRPRLVPAQLAQMERQAFGGSTREMEAIYGAALVSCETCRSLRSLRIRYAQAKWGGSYAEMDALAAGAPVAKNSKLRFLAALVLMDKAFDREVAKDEPGALTLANQACAIGEDAPSFAYRASVYERLDNLPAAQTDIDHAIALRPAVGSYFASRAQLDLYKKDWEAAGRDLLAALRVDPTDGSARKNYDGVVNDLAWMAGEAKKRGDGKEALRLLDLDAELAPASPLVQYTRMQILTGSKDDIAKSVAAAQVVLAGGPVPDDINEVRRMDYALSDSKRFEDILKIWNRYIAAHPDDGRAYLERAGTHKALNQITDAGNDARKACDLGFNEGCLHAKQLGGML